MAAAMPRTRRTWIHTARHGRRFDKRGAIVRVGRRSSPAAQAFGTRRIETDEDARDLIAMLRLNYERVVARHGKAA
jgi:hypothetical protein